MEAVTPTTAKQKRHWAARVGIGLAALVAAYGAASFAIDRGNLFVYLLTLVLLVISVREFVLAVRDSWRRKWK